MIFTSRLMTSAMAGAGLNQNNNLRLHTFKRTLKYILSLNCFLLTPDRHALHPP